MRVQRNRHFQTIPQLSPIQRGRVKVEREGWEAKGDRQGEWERLTRRCKKEVRENEMEMSYSTDWTGNIIKLIIFRMSECTEVVCVCACLCVCVIFARVGVFNVVRLTLELVPYRTVIEDFPAVFPCLRRAFVSFLCETIWNKKKEKNHLRCSSLHLEFASVWRTQVKYSLYTDFSL